MPKPTGYRLKDYIKALERCAEERGYGYVKHGYGSGSAYSFQIFQNRNDVEPAVIWSVHYGRGNKQEIYSDDLKKVWQKTAIPQDRFIEVLDNL